MAILSFIGKARTAIDSKGRTSFPKEFRRAMSTEDGDSVVVGPGPNRSLILYTESEWNRWMTELQARPRSPKSERFLVQQQDLSRICELDGQNRILLSRDQMEHAGMKGEIVFVGRTGKTCTVWAADRYDELFGKRTAEDFQEFDDAFYGDSSAKEQ